MLVGASSCAVVAGSPSPPKPTVVPATVVMMPPASTRRTRLLPVSAISRLPSEAIATSRGRLRRAAVARPPSPANPVTLPATVVIAPFGAIRRMRLLPVSATYTVPSDATAVSPG